MRYESWPKEDLIRKLDRVERENERLRKENQEQYSELEHLRFRVRHELEPRIQAERNSYDRWVSTPR